MSYDAGLVKDAAAEIDSELDRIEAMTDSASREAAIVPLAVALQDLFDKAAEVRRTETLRLYSERELSFAELGRLVGISKARAHQLITASGIARPQRAAGSSTPAEPAVDEDAEPTILYRVWGEGGVLLYVGISKDFGRRWKQHAKKQPWWSEMRRLTADEWFPSRKAAEAAEETAIKAEKPKYNKRHAELASA